MLAKLLAIYLDPDCTFWSSLENKPRSAISGMVQKLYGVKCGLSDVIVIFRAEAGLRVIFIELKSRVASASQVQKQIRLELFRPVPSGGWRAALAVRWRHCIFPVRCFGANGLCRSSTSGRVRLPIRRGDCHSIL
jgi:hypothetical protein